jgi:hypothetical protein
VARADTALLALLTLLTLLTLLQYRALSPHLVHTSEPLLHAPQLRAVLCVYGVLPRSLTITYPGFEHQLRRLREANITTDLYAFNLDTEGALVDGQRLDQVDLTIIASTHHESAKQSDVDALISSRCGHNLSHCRFRGNQDYSEQTTRNALRQLWSELRVGRFLGEAVRRGEPYDVAIVVGSDYYLALDISLKEVRDAARERNAESLYVSSVCDGWSLLGATDGFYIGQPKSLMPVLLRYNDLPSPLLDLPKEQAVDDYESVLARAIRRAGLRRLHSEMVFFKVRASGMVEWQGPTFVFKQPLPNVNLSVFPMLPGGTRSFKRTRQEAEQLVLRSYPGWAWCSMPWWLLTAPKTQVATVVQAWRTLVRAKGPPCPGREGDTRFPDCTRLAWGVCGRARRDRAAPLPRRAVRAIRSELVTRGRQRMQIQTQIQMQPLPRCFSRPLDFVQPIDGRLVPAEAGSARRAAPDLCPLRRPWEACARRRHTPGGEHALSHSFVPTSCELAPLDAGRLLQLLAGRTLMFVGDSTHVQLAVAVGCMLQTAHGGAALLNTSLSYLTAKALRKRCEGTPVDRCHWETGCADFVHGVHLCTCPTFSVGDRAALRWCLSNLRASDVVVYGSVGLHFHEVLLTDNTSSLPDELLSRATKHDPQDAARRLTGPARVPLLQRSAAAAATLEATALMDVVSQLPVAARPFVIWREVGAQHFSGAGGHYNGAVDYNIQDVAATCTPHGAAEMQRMQRWNPASNAVVEAHGVPVLRVWDSTQQAHGMHVGFGDCTHFCSPGIPNHWADLLYNMLKSLAPPAVTAPSQELRPFQAAPTGQSCFRPGGCDWL